MHITETEKSKKQAYIFSKLGVATLIVPLHMGA